MATYTTKTEIYQRVKKPLLERQRRARINKCLNSLKTLVADLKGDDAILRMDKAEMLEMAVSYMRQETMTTKFEQPHQHQQIMPLQCFRHGYMNAVNEVSRVMAATGINVDLGKSVMTHLGSVYKNLQQFHAAQTQTTETQQLVEMNSYTSAPMSPASSGYHSDCDESPAASPARAAEKLWRPW